MTHSAIQPIGPHNLPWPIPQNIDDSRNWRELPENERIKSITQSTLDWAHEDWMQVID